MDLEQKESLSDDSATVLGLNWAIKVERVTEDGNTTLKQPKNYDLLLTSTGIRCMTKVKDVVTGYANCGSYSESW